MGDKELIRKVHEMVGAVKMARTMGNFADAGRYSLYKQLKDSGAYKSLGKDWKDFCSEDLGRAQNTINLEIKMLEEYGESFLKAAERIGLSRRDLNALGSGLPDDAKSGIKKGVIKIGDSEFKVAEIEDNKDEFVDAVAALIRSNDEAKANLKAQTKLTEDFRKNNEKLHNALDRYENRDERYDENPNLLEEEYIVQMEGFRLTFDQFMKRIDPESEKMREFFREEDENGKPKKHKPTIKMRACYLEILGYMKKMAAANYGMAENLVGTADMFPENVYNPAMVAEAVEAMKARSEKKQAGK